MADGSMDSLRQQPIGPVEVVVEARDLDTDERSVSRFEVAPPVGADAQRRELERLVATVHPHARLRSFAAGAASFVDRQHLVVAHYPLRPPSGRPPVEEPRQDALFAA